MIYKVRIDATEVSHFPFDLIYLVAWADRKLIPRLFPWSLCLPVAEDSKLHRLLGHPRIDRIEQVPVGQRRYDVPRTFASVTARPNEYIPLLQKGAEQCFLVVPILPRKRNVCNAGPYEPVKDICRTWGPSYITASKHVAWKDHQKNFPAPRGKEVSRGDNRYERIFDERTILCTPDGPVNPPCLKCERHLLHLQEKCFFGQRVCWDTLILKDKRKKAQGDPDEQLQTDGDQPTGDPHPDTL